MQYVYLIACQDYFKIGIANNVPNRLAQLYTGNPFDMKVVVVYGFENAEAIERSLHQRFRHKRVRGEWFVLSENEIEVLKSVCELLGGQNVYYEEAVSEYEDVESQRVDTWRTARKIMDEAEILEISNASIQAIASKYSVSDRTASNWRAYARREVDDFKISQD